jgi:hypothetical protein
MESVGDFLEPRGYLCHSSRFCSVTAQACSFGVRKLRNQLSALDLFSWSGVHWPRPGIVYRAACFTHRRFCHQVVCLRRSELLFPAEQIPRTNLSWRRWFALISSPSAAGSRPTRLWEPVPVTADGLPADMYPAAFLALGFGLVSFSLALVSFFFFCVKILPPVFLVPPGSQLLVRAPATVMFPDFVFPSQFSCSPRRAGVFAG